MVHHLTILSVIHRLQPRYRIVVPAFGNGNMRRHFARFGTVPMLHSRWNLDEITGPIPERSHIPVSRQRPEPDDGSSTLQKFCDKFTCEVNRLRIEKGTNQLFQK